MIWVSLMTVIKKSYFLWEEKNKRKITPSAVFLIKAGVQGERLEDAHPTHPPLSVAQTVRIGRQWAKPQARTCLI